VFATALRAGLGHMGCRCDYVGRTTCTPDSCRLAATPESAESGQEQKLAIAQSGLHGLFRSGYPVRELTDVGQSA